VLGTILHQGNIFNEGDEDEGETAIGWMVADVGARVQDIEQSIVLATPGPEVTR